MSQNLPNLVVIGAMKCGTTSLHNYLSLHPQIYMAPDKELDFFIKKKPFYDKGLSWYESKFEQRDIVGEASPNYTKCHAFPGVPELMHEVIPNAKLIYIIRDPIKRAISHFTHQYIAGCESRDINEAFKDLYNSHYIQCSRYAFQLEKYLPYYDLDNILVISLEELSANRIETLIKVFNFLDVNADFRHPEFSLVHHQSSVKRRLTKFGEVVAGFPAGLRLCNLAPKLSMYQVNSPKLNLELKARLESFFQEDLEKLKTLSQVPEWCY